MRFNLAIRRFTAGCVLLLLPFSANAWFIFFPIPNLAKPPQLQSLIDALENSTQTRALAFVSEDKTFGAKYWVWGDYAGEVSQIEADRIALAKCSNALQAIKARTAGGQPIYDFGGKSCEMHPFTPNDGPKIAEANKKAAEEARRQKAAEEDARRLGAAEEAKRIAAAEEEKRAAAEEESKRIAVAEEEARQTRIEASRSVDVRPQSRRPAAGATQQIDFDVEATKAARILGCQPSEAKVMGADGGNVQYRVACIGSKVLLLSCDPSGLCLQRKPQATSKQ